MKLNKQTIYRKVLGDWVEDEDTLMDSNGEFVCNLEEQKGYFLTEEELKQLLSDYTDKILENVIIEEIGGVGSDGEYHEHYTVDKESITKQLPEFLKTILWIK